MYRQLQRGNQEAYSASCRPADAHQRSTDRADRCTIGPALPPSPSSPSLADPAPQELIGTRVQVATIRRHCEADICVIGPCGQSALCETLCWTISQFPSQGQILSPGQTIFCPVFSQSARKAARPLSVKGCLSSALMTDGGTVATSAPISALCLTWPTERMEAARICVFSSG